METSSVRMRLKWRASIPAYAESSLCLNFALWFAAPLAATKNHTFKTAKEVALFTIHPGTLTSSPTSDDAQYPMTQRDADAPEKASAYPHRPARNHRNLAVKLKPKGHQINVLAGFEWPRTPVPKVSAARNGPSAILMPLGPVANLLQAKAKNLRNVRKRKRGVRQKLVYSGRFLWL